MKCHIEMNNLVNGTSSSLCFIMSMMLNFPLFRIIHELQAVAEGVYMEGGVKKKTDMTSLYFDNRIFIQLQVIANSFNRILALYSH